ncbi:hypothetical protein VSX64_22625 [Aurantimonas sp. C2-6-R+9]|uniref:hypothetical protein n=1 Tax=unclassified Aurantimonas TaxID=2638230 RepID=UPI002E1A0020|nr:MULTISPECIES: hypothetical protein [unclassified Aurantimonas]MEC5293413.1 hypothetical protein [Aurantimonas sp. C2-3-R2]MEC5383569.1 hypothetical protein [Aurantimonas sp. C2-6-R+9]MEC5414494.1 hypothetical protein [Aurantimonas sp. C2-4-R8]
MPAQTLYIVQQFEKQGKRLIAGQTLQFKHAASAIERANRDASRFPGVVAVQQTVDTETGEVLEEPTVLARHGEVPQEFREE